MQYHFGTKAANREQYRGIVSKLWLEGATLKEIAEATNRTISSVSWMVTAFDLPRRQSAPRHKRPDDQAEAMERLWDEGVSAAGIVSAMAEQGVKITRSAVLGLAHRRGWAARQPSKPRATVKESAHPRASRKPVQADLPKPAPVHAEALNIPLLDARNGQCRYPMWGEPDGAPEYHVCGLPIARWSYCEHHAERTLVKPKKPEGKTC